MRTLREENAAQAALDDALDRWTRTIDAWEAITWVITRDPEVGVAVNETGSLRTYMLDGVVSLDLPSITLLYEITDDQIVILAARFADSPYRNAGRS